MLSFILPTVIKQELEEYCSVSDRTQSQVLGESVYEFYDMRGKVLLIIR